jgi:uncharacterized membrane protein
MDEKVTKEFTMLRYGPGGFHHAPGVFGWLFLALVAALFVLGVIALVRIWGTPHRHGTAFPAETPRAAAADPAITELRVRYARGDITWDDYVQRSHNLGYPITPTTAPTGPPPQPPPPSS